MGKSGEVGGSLFTALHTSGSESAKGTTNEKSARIMQRKVKCLCPSNSCSDEYASYKRMAEFSASDYSSNVSNGFTALLISRHYSALS